MKMEFVHENNLVDFIDYCRKFRGEFDHSFLIDEELKKYKPNDENPAYIVKKENQEVVGAVSLILDSYFRRGRKGRFRIFHTKLQTLEVYNLMLEKIKSHTQDLNQIFLFQQGGNEKVSALLKSLCFNIERYTYVLFREDVEVTEPVFPEGYFLKTFEFEKDEEDYCHVRNTGFANLKGSETPLTPEEVTKMKDWEETLEGGIFILYHQNKPVGVIRAYKEEDNGNYFTGIGPLALVPEYRGKGLGKNLLRAGLAFGRSKGLPRAVLSVNAKNEQALDLYLNEGFKKEEEYLCFVLDLDSAKM